MWSKEVVWQGGVQQYSFEPKIHYLDRAVLFQPPIHWKNVGRMMSKSNNVSVPKGKPTSQIAKWTSGGGGELEPDLEPVSRQPPPPPPPLWFTLVQRPTTLSRGCHGLCMRHHTLHGAYRAQSSMAQDACFCCTVARNNRLSENHGWSECH